MKAIAYEGSFAEPYVQQKIPFDNSINLETASVENNANELDNFLRAVATKFGVKHLHLVAHSKGGLDTRRFLAKIGAENPQNLGILSFTTLSTPHHGSVGADYAIDARDASWDPFTLTETLVQARTMVAYAAGNDAGTPYLRVYRAEEFNLSNEPMLPKSFTVDGESNKIYYFSIGADANANGRKDDLGNFIQQDETHKTPFETHFFGLTILEFMYDLLGNVHSTTVGFRNTQFGRVSYVREFPTNEFKINDFLVTVESSKLPTFSPLPTAKANHGSISNPQIGNQVLSIIRSVQPIK